MLTFFMVGIPVRHSAQVPVRNVAAGCAVDALTLTGGVLKINVVAHAEDAQVKAMVHVRPGLASHDAEGAENGPP